MYRYGRPFRRASTVGAPAARDVQELRRYLQQPGEEVVTDLAQMWRPHPGSGGNPFEGRWRPESCHDEALIRRLLSPLQPQYRLFALGVFWTLLLDRYGQTLDLVQDEGELRAVEHTQAWVKRVMLDRQQYSAGDQPPMMADGTWRNLIAASADPAITAGAAADTIFQAISWVNLHVDALGRNASWVCSLLDSWWRNVTSRLAFRGGINVRRWPTPKREAALSRYLARFRENLGLTETPFPWTTLVADQETARRALVRLQELVDGPLVEWSEHPAVRWASEHGHRFLQLNPYRVTDQDVEDLRAIAERYLRVTRAERGYRSYIAQNLEHVPVVLESVLNALYYTWLRFEENALFGTVGNAYRPGHSASALNALLNGVAPAGEDPFLPASQAGWVQPVARWTMSPWKEIVQDWWTAVWNQIMEIYPGAAVGG